MGVVPFAGVTILQADIRVGDMMRKLQDRFKERRDKLYDLLQINENWRMHLVSDGQRRRVQIMLSLLRPFEILFLDEITTDLDVVTRHDLMRYLISECENRGVSIVYTTHIFDGLDGWATHLAYLSAGVLTTFAPVEDIPELSSQTSGSSTLMKCISTWIRRDRQSNLSKQTESYDQLSSTKINPDGSAGGYTAGRMKLDIDFQ